MRMRKKRNLIPRMERCAHVQIKNPEDYKGLWAQKFPGYSSYHLELGCGKGRFTAEMASQNPDIFLIAIEKVPEAMVVGMERVCRGDIKNVRFIEYDASKIADIFAPGEISRIYINFCDPWPKNRNAKRRLTAPGFLKIYRELLPENGEIWFKTDNVPLFDYSLKQFEKEGWQLREVARDLHKNGPVGVMTDYEIKFVSQGVKINRFVAVRPQSVSNDNG